MAKSSRTLKVFCSEEARAGIASRHEVVEEYESFLLVRTSPAGARGLARLYPVEDISDQYELRVGARTIDTSRPRVDPRGRTRPHAAYRGAKRLARGKHHYLVQFVGPIKKAWLARLKRLGAEPRAPYADFAYVVRCDEESLKRVAAERCVRWLGHLSHRDRLHLEAKTRLPRTKTLRGVYTVEFFDGQDLHRAVAAIRKLGLRILSRSDEAGVLTVRSDDPEKRTLRLLDRLSAVHGVRSVRRRSLKRTSNDVAARILGAESAWKEPLELTGKGEIVAVCDTGLDTGHPETIHQDFRGRIVAIKSYPITPIWAADIYNPGDDDGPGDEGDGHGTHVAGSVLGSGAASLHVPGITRPIRGLAPEARLVFQAVEQELDWKDFADELEYGRYPLAGLPEDLTPLFRWAYDRGARIHSDSWGGGEPGEYDEQCRQLDEFVWRHGDFCVVVSAGNDGTDADGDGKINAMSVTPPATAKNAIAVGATESLRPVFHTETYGGWWPDDYPVAPFRKAPMANDPEQVVAFSSRGPTEDGRFKPDIVAPGTFILSTRSRRIPENDTGWAPFPKSKAYFYMGGTSMATPLVSGAVALLRQFLRKRVGYPLPSAALLKACLLLGAKRMPGGGASALVDNAQGAGRVDLAAVVKPRAPVQAYFYDDDAGLQTGQADEFTVQVRSKDHPLRVALAHSDYPGPHLVNNLNLLLVSPSGQHHVGNAAGSGALALDRRNNVEIVQVKRPTPGTWRLRIVASNVPHGPQPYAFALSGHVTV